MMATSGLDFGVLIYIDGVAGGGSPVIPKHPDEPDPPRAFTHTSSPTEITIGWQAPLDWGNETNPTGIGRYYEIAYRRNINPDDQTDETTALNYEVEARGGTSLTKFAIRAVNAAGRQSAWVNLPALDFDHPSRRYGRRYSRRYA